MQIESISRSMAAIRSWTRVGNRGLPWTVGRIVNRDRGAIEIGRDLAFRQKQGSVAGGHQRFQARIGIDCERATIRRNGNAYAKCMRPQGAVIETAKFANTLRQIGAAGE